MFKSKRRPIVVPQSEHARLSGMLAALWGNDDFDKPVFDFQSFVLGVTLHDRGYGSIDNNPIGEMTDEAWFKTQRDGIQQGVENPVANIPSLLHMRRLLTFSHRQNTQPLIDLANQHIGQSLAHTSHTLEEFEWADHITRICDRMAFGFSFEAPEEVERPVCQRLDSDETTVVSFSLDGSGTIHVDPWPFSVEHYAGFIIGYELEGYPQRLEPLVLPFAIAK